MQLSSGHCLGSALGPAGRWAGSKASKQAGRQASRQKDRQAEWQAGREIGRLASSRLMMTEADVLESARMRCASWQQVCCRGAFGTQLFKYCHS